jgi:hypothetical protein
MHFPQGAQFAAGHLPAPSLEPSPQKFEQANHYMPYEQDFFGKSEGGYDCSDF